MEERSRSKHRRTIVAELADSILVTPQNRMYINRLGYWVVVLNELDRREHEHVFVELAELALQYDDAGNLHISQCFSELARIGLEPLASLPTRHDS